MNVLPTDLVEQTQLNEVDVHPVEILKSVVRGAKGLYAEVRRYSQVNPTLRKNIRLANQIFILIFGSSVVTYALYMKVLGKKAKMQGSGIKAQDILQEVNSNSILMPFLQLILLYVKRIKLS